LLFFPVSENGAVLQEQAVQNRRSTCTLAAVALFLALTAFPPEPRASSSLVLEGEGALSGGYDTNVCILRTTYPALRHDDVCTEPGNGFLGLAAGLSLEAMVTPWFGLEVEPQIDYIGYFEAGPILSPSARLGMIFKPLDFFRIDLGAAYRWFLFQDFPETEFHEPGPYALLGFMTDEHLVQAGFTWLQRTYSLLDESDWETRLTLLWSWEAARFFSLELAARWAHQESYSDLADLDEFLFSIAPRFSIKWFYLQPSYIPGVLSYAVQDEALFAHRVHVTLGAVPVPQLDISIFYGYEQLFADWERRHGGYDPSYIRHVGGLSVAVRWTVSHPPLQPEPFMNVSPAACTGNRCLFRVKAEGTGPVYLAGSFNGWKEKKTALEGPDAEGFFKVTLTLPSGRHSYVFISDGSPLVPENAEAYSEDEFGMRSAVITVP
jgi:hypothetical protein